jgi:hypothetical protein
MCLLPKTNKACKKIKNLKSGAEAGTSRMGVVHRSFFDDWTATKVTVIVIG